MTHRVSRRAVLAGTSVGLASVAGCLGGGGSGAAGETRTESSTETDAGETSDSDGGDDGTPTYSVDTSVLRTRTQLPLNWGFATLREETRSGGPPKDGIPSVDDPTFVDVAGGDGFLDDSAVVFGVVRGDDVKAYPQSILVWHEIANDVVDGDPVSVTYCPLTGTAMGFERGETEFGVSGNLVNSNLVMYDRETDSRWPQVLATAVSGPFQGQSLTEFPVTWTTWGQWKAKHPETVVMSENTGFVRNYSRDPYGSRGYYEGASTLFPPLERDDRFHPKETVIGARPPEGPVAFLKSSLRESGTLTVERDGVRFLAVYEPALDTAHLYRNPDGEEFTYAQGEVTDDAGETFAVESLPLERVIEFDAMWFAWYGFYPETGVVE